MIFVCYLIVCVNILYCINQAETVKYPKLTESEIEEQRYLLSTITNENQDQFVASAMAPYENMTYEEQLRKKQSRCSEIVNRIVNHSESLGISMTCKLLQIAPSPVTEAYRNKDDFHVGYGIDKNPKTVGIKLGKVSLGKAFIFHPTIVSTMKESHKRVAKVYEDFVRSSPLPVCSKIHDGGHWRSIRVRSNEEGDIMVFVIVQPRGFTNRDVLEQQKALKHYFLQHLPNITLMHQKCIHQQCSPEKVPPTLLYGKSFLLETINGLKFKITPDSLFPVNKFSAEVLYNNVIRTAELTPNTTLVDICSGTGITSIVLSKYVREAIGVDYIRRAYLSSKINAEFNNIHNVNFLLCIVERKLKSLLRNLNSSDIVAIVNSANTRPGVDVIKTIHSSPKISRLLYISVKPDSEQSLNNYNLLCSNTTSLFPPFRLVKAIPIDMLPQTTHFELILVFER